jgi:tubulin polyglutamylase TTLL5
LEDNGLRENKDNWSVMWACSNLKSNVYQQLSRFQKVNHFPKSTEITRKDSMYQNLMALGERSGRQHFKFVPPTFVLPAEAPLLQKEMSENPGKTWIVKPSCSS